MTNYQWSCDCWRLFGKIFTVVSYRECFGSIYIDRGCAIILKLLLGKLFKVKFKWDLKEPLPKMIIATWRFVVTFIIKAIYQFQSYTLGNVSSNIVQGVDCADRQCVWKFQVISYPDRNRPGGFDWFINPRKCDETVVTAVDRCHCDSSVICFGFPFDIARSDRHILGGVVSSFEPLNETT